MQQGWSSVNLGGDAGLINAAMSGLGGMDSSLAQLQKNADTDKTIRANMDMLKMKLAAQKDLSLQEAANSMDKAKLAAQSALDVAVQNGQNMLANTALHNKGALETAKVQIMPGMGNLALEEKKYTNAREEDKLKRQASLMVDDVDRLFSSRDIAAEKEGLNKQLSAAAEGSDEYKSIKEKLAEVEGREKLLGKPAEMAAAKASIIMKHPLAQWLPSDKRKEFVAKETEWDTKQYNATVANRNITNTVTESMMKGLGDLNFAPGTEGARLKSLLGGTIERTGKLFGKISGTVSGWKNKEDYDTAGLWATILDPSLDYNSNTAKMGLGVNSAKHASTDEYGVGYSSDTPVVGRTSSDKQKVSSTFTTNSIGITEKQFNDAIRILDQADKTGSSTDLKAAFENPVVQALLSGTKFNRNFQTQFLNQLKDDERATILSTAKGAQEQLDAMKGGTPDTSDAGLFNSLALQKAALPHTIDTLQKDISDDTAKNWLLNAKNGTINTGIFNNNDAVLNQYLGARPETVDLGGIVTTIPDTVFSRDFNEITLPKNMTPLDAFDINGKTQLDQVKIAAATQQAVYNILKNNPEILNKLKQSNPTARKALLGELNALLKQNTGIENVLS